jgi:hypothetical protein
MNKATTHGAPAFLLINMRREKKNGKVGSNNRTWAFDWRRWSELQAELQGRKSIPTDLLTDTNWFIPIPRAHVFVGLTRTLAWDLRCITRYLDEKTVTKPRPAPWSRLFNRRSDADAVQLQDGTAAEAEG